ncbi:hypothetical protein B0H19DRAFT_1385729 [Mycena capillaripes]|nr:hypothetical protein B0H19DRAFT_1385729 [Mycena capillaripes]
MHSTFTHWHHPAPLHTDCRCHDRLAPASAHLLPQHNHRQDRAGLFESMAEQAYARCCTGITPHPHAVFTRPTTLTAWADPMEHATSVQTAAAPS